METTLLILFLLSFLANVVFIYFIVKITNNSTDEIDYLNNEKEELRQYILNLFETCKTIEGSSIVSEDELVKLLYRKVKQTLDFLESKYLKEEEKNES